MYINGKKMNILALDTSDEVFSAALSTKNGFWSTEIDSGAKHSELLMECADSLLKYAGIKQNELSLIACMRGPGSFTGLRIGFSTAKGLGMALSIPITSVPTLDCLAYSFKFWPGIILPTIDAKKSCFFSALYRGKERLCEDMDASSETIFAELKKHMISAEEPVLITGSGAELLYPLLSPFFPEIKIDSCARKGRSRELIEIAKCCIIQNSNNLDSGPVYIRKSDAELNRK